MSTYKRYLVWNEKGYLDESEEKEWTEDYEATHDLEADAEVSPDDLAEWFYEVNAADFQQLREEMSQFHTNTLVCIADLGLWNGKRHGYRILGHDLSTIFDCIVGDYFTVESDGNNLLITDSHHDGTNHYTIREMRHGRDTDTFCSKVYNGHDTPGVLNYYTTSVAGYLQELWFGPIKRKQTVK